MYAREKVGRYGTENRPQTMTGKWDEYTNEYMQVATCQTTCQTFDKYMLYIAMTPGDDIAVRPCFIVHPKSKISLCNKLLIEKNIEDLKGAVALMHTHLTFLYPQQFQACQCDPCTKRTFCVYLWIWSRINAGPLLQIK